MRRRKFLKSLVIVPAAVACKSQSQEEPEKALGPGEIRAVGIFSDYPPEGTLIAWDQIEPARELRAGDILHLEIDFPVSDIVNETAIELPG